MDNEIVREALDQAYFRRREKEERTAAAKAGHDKARAAHETMANRYHELVSDREAPEQPTPAPDEPARAA